MKTRKTIAATMIFVGFFLLISGAGGIDQCVATPAQAATVYTGGIILMLLGGLWINAIEKRENRK